MDISLPVTGPVAARRRAVRLSEDALVEFRPLLPDRALPLLAAPTVAGVDLAVWAAANRALIEERLARHGAVLCRGFAVRGLEDFARFMTAVADNVVEYRERSSPRHQVGDRIYSSTDHPSDQEIFVHNENSYQSTWPAKIAFYCAKAAADGGETPLSDCRAVLRSLPPDAVARFDERGVMYVRNYGDGLGLPWQTVFGSDDPRAVEAHCARHRIALEWKPGARLRTRVVRPALVSHPRTGERAWFNHATFFHESTLEPSTREALLASLAYDDLPTNSFYGDGRPLEPELLDALRAAYRRETVVFPWQDGDVLLLDNVLVAHGRRPYRGERQVLVMMAEPHAHD